jgi:hypothetical protein
MAELVIYLEQLILKEYGFPASQPQRAKMPRIPEAFKQMAKNLNKI